MNSQIVFSLADAGVFLIWILLAAVLVIITMILIKVYKIVKNALKLLEDNQVCINKVMHEAPSLTSNVNIILGEVAHGTKAFRSTVDNVAETTDSITKPFKKSTTVIEKIIWVLNMFSSMLYSDEKSKKTEKSIRKSKPAEKKEGDKSDLKSKNAENSKMAVYEKVKSASEKAASNIIAGNEDASDSDSTGKTV